MLSKKSVLKHLPNLQTLRKEAREKEREGEKLICQADKAYEICYALDGVHLYEDFPIKTVKLLNGVEIVSGCREVHRSAFVRPANSSNRYVVTTYTNDGMNTGDGIPIEGEYTRPHAMQLAKEFVAFGRKGKKVNRES